MSQGYKRHDCVSTVPVLTKLAHKCIISIRTEATLRYLEGEHWVGPPAAEDNAHQSLVLLGYDLYP